LPQSMGLKVLWSALRARHDWNDLPEAIGG
jgi:hypothetical protein